MWTEAHRARHEARLKEVVSPHAVAQVARWPERADPPRGGRATPYAAVVRALAWHLRVGGAWRALPRGLVHRRTAYGRLRRWLDPGLFDALSRPVAGLRRRAAGREPEPRPAVIDTQGVKCIPVRGPRGYDAAEKVPGRERVALVDADGTWLAVAVVPASVQDRDCLEALSGASKPGRARAKRCWTEPSRPSAARRGATATGCTAASSSARPTGRASSCSNAAGSWNVAVERSFGWLVHRGGLLRDRAGRLGVSAARLACAAILSGVGAPINPRPIQAAAS